MKNVDNEWLHSKQDIINEKLVADNKVSHDKNIFKMRETPKVKWFDIRGKINYFIQ